MEQCQKPLKFGPYAINDESPALVVAEFSDGHCGNIEHAKALVDAAKAAGADVAKFQMHFPDIEMTRGVTMWAGDLQDILKKCWLSPEGHAEMIEYCKNAGIQYLCTPFSPHAVDVLNAMGVEGFKTGSGEIANLPFHRKLARISARTEKPVFISTGMCTEDEIAETVSIYREEGGHFLLMHCTSEYPVRDYTHTHLRSINGLKSKFGVFVGQSDHTLDNYTAFAAVTLGARVIEKHFTLDRKGPFPDDFMSLDPPMMKDLVDGIRKIEQALSQKGPKTLSAEEENIRAWAFHSVVTNRILNTGESITSESVRPARPGWGIPAKFLDERYSRRLLGRRIKKTIPENTVVTWDDII